MPSPFRSRHAVRPLIGGAVATIALLSNGPAAYAASDVDAGWWTASPVAVAPDAPADSLVIQGGSDASQPLAYAAVSYLLSSGETPETLALRVAEGSASTPTAGLTVCPLTDAFSPANGGPAASGPHFDCTTKVTAAAAGDGSGYTFDLRGLGQTDAVALAILPNAATDRVVLARPGPESLRTTAPDPGSASTDSSVDAAFVDSPTPVASTTFDVPPAPPLALDPPTALVTETRRETARAAAASAAFDTPLTGGAGDGPSRTPIAFAGLVLVAGALWLSTGRSGALEEQDA